MVQVISRMNADISQDVFQGPLVLIMLTDIFSFCYLFIPGISLKSTKLESVLGSEFLDSH